MLTLDVSLGLLNDETLVQEKRVHNIEIMPLIPQTNISFKYSRAALSIVIAAAILAILLTAVTFRNIQKERRLMENFLFHEGLALIRSFEAGARTSMRHFRQGTDPLTTLVDETVKEEAVAYIKIITDRERVLAEAGEVPLSNIRPSVASLLRDEKPVKTLYPDEKVFEVARFFKPMFPLGKSRMDKMMRRWQTRPGQGPEPRIEELFNRKGSVIYLGLRTNEFDQSRHKDIRNALLLGGILFVSGSAGFYLLFLYQGARVAKSTLADMELYTKNVIESMPAGLITLDEDGKIVSCNTHAERITDCGANQLTGRVLTQEIPEIPVVTNDGGPLIDEPITCYHKDGTRVPVKVSTSPLFSSDGRKTGQVLILRDVGEILEMEEKLERVRRLAALGRMAAGIAHEIRNPLSTLKGFAQYFGKKFVPEAPEQEYAQLMVEEVDRLNRSISALLQFSKPREPEYTTVCLNDILIKTGKLLQDDFDGKGISLQCTVPTDKIFLEADPDLLVQVLLNLLQNSLAACARGGKVVLGVSALVDAVLLIVEDTGRGMNDDELSQMFDPFFTTRKTGTGLGLAVVHQIIQQHNGDIEVESETGQGTVVKITMPLTHRVRE